MAESQELKVDITRFEQSLTAFMVGSKRAVEDVLKQQMKGIIRNVIRITPPGHFVQTTAGNSLVIGNAAKQAGQRTVTRDISSVYGTAAQAYTKVKEALPASAAAFWKAHKAQDQETAKDIARAAGFSFAAFDGGKAHQNLKRGRRPRPARQKLFWVNDPTALAAYLKEVQQRVFFLAAGWVPAARAFGVAVPQMVARHSAHGSVRIEVTDNVIRFTATNSVRYARGIADMERRVQWAVDAQARNMEKILTNQLEQAAKRAGFVIAGTLAS